MKTKIIVSEQDGIDLFEDICDELLSKLFGLSFHEVLVTDLSSVYDFTPYTDEDTRKMKEDLKINFDIDLNETKDSNLLSICRLISQKRETKINQQHH